MTNRYEVIVEWHGDTMHYRLYDKERDALLERFESMRDAMTAREGLISHDPDAKNNVGDG